MPKSKHHRKGKTRPRAHQTAPPPRNPEPSPTWVPATALGLLVGGVVVIVLGYLPAISERIQTWPPLGANNGLVLGFVLIIAGFVFLTRWR
jgi:hypothetical protein